MTVKMSSLRADTRAEAEGEWVAVPALEGVRLLVRSPNYGPFKMALAALNTRMARKHGDDPYPPEELDRANGQLYADHLLLGWEGFDVPYSPEVAAEELTAPAARALRQHVAMAAGRVGVRAVAYLDDAAKN